MKKSLGVKPYMFPQPVLILASYDESGKPDAMNAAWGGIIENDEIVISLSSHQTTDNIHNRKAFTVSMGTAETTVSCDYVGVVSQKKESDKMNIAGFTVTKSETVDAPVINELPLALECEFKAEYDGKVIGKIKNVVADESILTPDGKVDITKLDPICFDISGNAYYKLGEKTGDAFKCGLTLKK